MTGSSGQVPKPDKFKDMRVTISKKGKWAISAAALERRDTVTSPPPGGTKTELPVCLERQRCWISEVASACRNQYSYHKACGPVQCQTCGFNQIKSELPNSSLGSQLIPLRDHTTTENTSETR